MKKTVKFIALFLSVLMALSGLSVTVFAEPDAVYTVKVVVGEGGFAMAGDRTVFGGTSTSVDVNHGDTLSFEIMPDFEYEVASLEVNGIAVGVSDGCYNLENISADTDVVISFKTIGSEPNVSEPEVSEPEVSEPVVSEPEPVKQYTVGVSVGNGGSAVVGETTVVGGTSSDIVVDEGDSLTIKVTPNEGYEIDSFKIDGAVIDGTSHTLNGIFSDAEISVTFKEIPPEIKEYAVRVVVDNGGSVEVGAQTIKGGNTANVVVGEGENLVVTIAPADGYELDSVKVDGENVEITGNSYTLTAISKNVTVAVEFKETVVEYNVQLSASGNGSISVGDVSVKEGTSDKFAVDSAKSLTVTVSPDDGYEIKSLTVNGAEVEVTGDSYTLNGLSGDTVITAVFGITTYDVTFNLTGKGSIKVMEKDTSKVLGEVVNDGSQETVSGTFELNGNVKFLITTDGSYEIVCGEPRCANVGNLWFFSPVSCDSENNIVFRNDGNPEIPGNSEDPGNSENPGTSEDPGNNAADHTVKITVGDGGSVVAGEKTVNGGNGSNMLIASGESLTVTITPNEGYELKSFQVNGVDLELTEIVDNTYNVEKVEENLTILVTFQTIGGETPENLITAESIDWTLSEITIDVNDKEVAKDVFDKIAALEPAADKYVTFVSENGCFYVPYGGASGMAAETLIMAITPLTEGADYSKLLENYKGNSADFKAYTFAFGSKDIPAGTKVSFNVGSVFTDKETELLSYENSELGVKTPLVIGENGVTEPVYYSNESILVCGVVKVEEEESSEELESSEILSVVIGESSEDSDAVEEGGNNTLIVVLVIVLVAVLGAAALFIVKWRQEKF